MQGWEYGGTLHILFYKYSMLTLDKNSDFKRVETAKIQSKYYDLDVNIVDTEVWGYDALDQSIENVLLTNKGERIFNYSFGTPLIELLFENDVDTDRLVDQALDIIETWVPIKIDRSKTNLQRDKENHAISFFIYYNSNDGMIRNHCFARRLRK